MKESRLAGIDAFRLAAAFSVILLHVGEYPGLDPAVGVKLRLLGRWAVPFFFIVSGYFAAPYVVKDPTKFAAIAAKGLAIFAIANVLLLPLSLISVGIGPTVKRVLSFQIITDGVYDHLWFLSSLAFSMLIFYALLSYSAHKTIMTLAGVSLVLMLMDAYYPNHRPIWMFARYISCFPFIYLGVILRSKNINPKMSVSLAILSLGVLLQAIEVYILHRFLDKNPFEHDFLVGTVPFAAGMFLIALKLPKTKSVLWLAELGVKYSLGIYIFHPYFTYLFQKIDNGFIDDTLLSMVVVPLVFLLTLLLLLLINRYNPILSKLLSGDQKAVQKIDALNPLPTVLPEVKNE